MWGDVGRCGEMWADIPHLGAGAGAAVASKGAVRASGRGQSGGGQSGGGQRGGSGKETAARERQRAGRVALLWRSQRWRDSRAWMRVEMDPLTNWQRQGSTQEKPASRTSSNLPQRSTTLRSSCAAGRRRGGHTRRQPRPPERRRPLARKRRKCAGRRERARGEELLRREAAVRASGVPPWSAPTAGGHRAWRGGGSGGKRPSGETAGILESFLKRRGGNGERADLGGDDAAAGFHRCSRESTVVQNQVTHVGGGADTFGRP